VIAAVRVAASSEALVPAPPGVPPYAGRSIRRINRDRRRWMALIDVWYAVALTRTCPTKPLIAAVLRE
jgi:hypothetical protein